MTGYIVESLKLSQVKISGYLNQRYIGNIKYLLQVLDDHEKFMLDAYRKRKRRIDEEQWDGEYAGKWLDAASKAAANTGDVLLLKKVNSFARLFRSLQESDGYMGIEDKEHKGKATWDIWNQWYALTGLITHYEQLNNKDSLISAKRTGEWIINNYEVVKDSKDAFFKSAHNGGCNVDIIDQLIRLYKHNKKKEILKFVKAISKHYPPIKKMRNSGKVLIELPFENNDSMTENSLQNPKNVYMMHAYVLFAYLGGLVELASVERNKDELQWLESVWEDILENHLYPTGGCAFRERLREDSPNDSPDDEQQETCATVEWLLLNHRLYKSTIKVKYMHMMEKIIYNTLFAAQSRNGMKWSYYTPLRYHKRRFSGPTKCCYWSGPRGVAMLPELIYAKNDKNIYINIFEESKAEFFHIQEKIIINQITDYPISGKIYIEINLSNNIEFALNIRIPQHSRSANLSINSKSKVFNNTDGKYISLHRKWSDGDSIEINFDIPTILQQMKNYGVIVCRGTEIMAMDSRDNEKFVIDSLNIDRVEIPEDIKLIPWGTIDGRRIYKGKVVINNEYKEMIFTPYAEAGEDMSCFRTVFPKNQKIKKGEM